MSSKYESLKEATHSYIGRCQCGAIVAAIVDAENIKRDVAKALKEWVLDGLRIERVTHNEVRQGNWGCICEGAEKPGQQLSLFEETEV